MSKVTVRILPLALILVLALALRVWGLDWGLPTAAHYFSYHPDESTVLGVAMGMDLFHGRLLPHFYNYGSLQLYLVNFANSLAFMFGGVDIVPKDFAAWYPQWARQFEVGRCLTVAMGVSTVGITSALGARLWSRPAGLWAAGLLAVMPLHAQHSHWLTVDVPATFWGTLSLYWTARLVTNDPRASRAAVLAGLFAGLATATKYNMALVLVPLAWACLLPRNTGGTVRRQPKVGALGLLAFTLAFLAACPGVLLEPQTFLAGLQYEAVHVRNGDDPTFKDTGNGFVYQIVRNLDAGLGLPLLLLALAGAGYALRRRQAGDGLLAAFALPYYVLISLAAVRYARYTIPLLPVLALWGGRLAAEGLSSERPVWRQAGRLGVAVVALFTLADCVWLVRAMALPDPRDRARAWLDAHAPSPTPLGFAAQPWFDAPPVSPWFSAPRPGAWRQTTAPETQARIVYSKDWDVSALPRAPIVVLTEYAYGDALRLKSRAAEDYLGTLRRDYGAPLVFSDPHAPFGGRRTIAGLPTQDLPHDMLYTSPTILIYRRR